MQKTSAIRKYLDTYGADGHTIIKAEALPEMGFDSEFVAKFAYDHKSGKHPKEKIFDKHGNVFESLYGVYTLDFLYGIATDIGADKTAAHQKMGRGFQAQELVRAINAVIKEDTDD